MPKIQFQPTFSTGNVLTILSMLVIALGGYFTVVHRVEANTEDIATNTLAVKELDEVKDALQIEIVRSLTELRTDVKFLRRTVEKMERQK